jgi:Zn-dependent protease
MITDPTYIIMAMTVIILAVSIHEYAHAKFADLAGDRTPAMMGRVTLNPLAHLDPLGTLLMFITVLYGVGIGWGKPVMMRPQNMRNPRWDHFVAVLAGPVSNLVQAFLYGAVLRIYLATSPASISGSNLFGGAATNPLLTFLLLGVLINVSLFCFNMLPIGPLDGSWLVSAFLPDPIRYRWIQFNQGIGTFVLLGLILVSQASGGGGILQAIIGPMSNFIFRALGLRFG